MPGKTSSPEQAASFVRSGMWRYYGAHTAIPMSSRQGAGCAQEQARGAETASCSRYSMRHCAPVTDYPGIVGQGHADPRDLPSENPESGSFEN